MSLILQIDAATEKAQVSIAADAIVLAELHNNSFMDHASFIQPAIEQLVKDTGISLTSVNAIAITAGPGSYTGLRVAMASAKGLCYALNKPLITLNTLEVMAASAISRFTNNPGHTKELFCPMIDARRMEVYTAIYDSQMHMLLPPSACLLSSTDFSDHLQQKKVIFFGSGSKKWESVCKHPNAVFMQADITPLAMASLAEKNFIRGSFADLAHSEPIYLKEFHNIIKTTN